MKGESPMIAPVCGLRSGAPVATVRSAITDDAHHQRMEREPQPPRLLPPRCATAGRRGRRGAST
jgi:hypothetical protein